MKRDKYVKGNLDLVRYHGCVLAEEMVLSGLMEQVERFEARDDDVIVAR